MPGWDFSQHLDYAPASSGPLPCDAGVANSCLAAVHRTWAKCFRIRPFCDQISPKVTPETTTRLGRAQQSTRCSSIAFWLNGPSGGFLRGLAPAAPEPGDGAVVIWSGEIAMPCTYRTLHGSQLEVTDAGNHNSVSLRSPSKSARQARHRRAPTAGWLTPFEEQFLHSVGTLSDGAIAHLGGRLLLDSMTQAEAFWEHFQSSWFIGHDEQPVGRVWVRVTTSDNSLDDRNVKDEAGFAEFLIARIARLDIPKTGWLPAVVGINGEDYQVDVALQGNGGGVRLRFADGSERSLDPQNVRPYPVDDASDVEDGLSEGDSLPDNGARFQRALDRGLALLEPITVEEVGNVEALVAELYKAYALDSINPIHAEKIRELAELLHEVARDAVPGETPRWQLIGVVGAILRKLFRSPFRDALALTQLLQILAKIRWIDLYNDLQQLLR